MTKLFLDVLDKPRREILTKLGVFGDSAVLGGGTALALQIGHRKSFDFDFYTRDVPDEAVSFVGASVSKTEIVDFLEKIVHTYLAGERVLEG